MGKLDKPIVDLTGKKFHMLTVVKLHENRAKRGEFQWECKCDCGSDKVVIVITQDLKRGRKKHCGCRQNIKEKLPVDLTDQMFGKLTVIRMDRDKQKGNKSHYVWECRCDCGNITYVTTGNLRSGQTKSCGCLNINPDSPYKTDPIFKRLLRIWTGMKKRCSNPNYEHYNLYGGRGITVCEDWQSFDPFYNWSLKNGYKDGLQIDRIDTNGNYEPSNCRWVTPKENSQNRRNNKFYTINGVTKMYSDWAEEIGISRATFGGRIEEGWTDEEILMPKGYKRNR